MDVFSVAFQTSRVEVEYGEPAVLHCYSSVLEEKGVVHWELRGEDVIILREGEAQVSEKFKGRVELPSEEQIREGNWSIVLRETRLRDADMYECIFGGATTISTVWLSVSEPQVDPFITAFEGTEVDLACFIKPEREHIKRFYWTMNGRFLIQHDHQTLSVMMYRYKFPKSMKFNEEEFHLYLRPTRNESGKYQCWYTTGESDSPKLALPESYTLTVVGLTIDPGNLHSFKTTTDVLPPSETAFDMEETNKNVWGSSVIFLLDVTTAAGTSDTPTDHLPVTLEMSTQIMEATESVETSSIEQTRTSQEMVTLLSDEANAVEATGFQTELPGLLEDSTQLIQDDGHLLPSDLANTQQTEPVEEKETFSDKDNLVATWSVFQLGDFPWVRIGIIGGVLLITVVVLCVLRALHHI
ncbi:uncharacterized protein LOC114140866 isoform X2 [Xiphophorus couchianus]|uniref:uncharacterized protein LOC114140866 isoform X2 n=1 Tax=Xiphophorus couchianus TaxID=32473 RepID=UPI001016CC91|nr:uncharacterized protein LOC114140866 isoform X2 [Xiphophorus couchianus]